MDHAAAGRPIVAAIDGSDQLRLESRQGHPGDHRVWPAIDGWAAGVAAALSFLLANESTAHPAPEVLPRRTSAGVPGDR
jgi:hypothetical protein